MSGPVFEPRSFQRSDDEPRAQAWVDEVESWDAIASRALIHRVRWHTGLSQSEFAAAYRIDLEHLRDLERGAVQPNSALVAYLSVIDRAPELVRTTLTTC